MRERRFVDLIDLLNIAECNQARHTEKRAEERMMELLLVLLQVQYTATAKRNNNHKPIVHHNNLQLHKSDPHRTLRCPSHLSIKDPCLKHLLPFPFMPAYHPFASFSNHDRVWLDPAIEPGFGICSTTRASN